MYPEVIPEVKKIPKIAVIGSQDKNIGMPNKQDEIIKMLEEQMSTACQLTGAKVI